MKYKMFIIDYICLSTIRVTFLGRGRIKIVYHIYLLAFYHLVFKDIHQQIFLFNWGLKNGDLLWDFSHNYDLKFRWIVKLKCAIPS